MGPMSLVLLVAACLLDRHHALAESSCNATEYYNASSLECAPCTNCTADGRLELSPCSADGDAVCHERCPEGSFLDGGSNSCRNCSTCNLGVETRCTATNDTVCNECPEGFRYSNLLKACIVNCTQCPSRQCSSVYRCLCEDPCSIGDRCQLTSTDPPCAPLTEPTGTPEPTVPSQSSETSSFSPITSALVALGAVLGIVIFSVLFVLLGVANSCRRGVASSSSSSDNTESSNGSTETHLAKTSSSLTSLYAFHQSPSSLTDYRTSLDFSSVAGLYGHASSSPRLGRPLSASSRNRDRVWTPV